MKTTRSTHSYGPHGRLMLDLYPARTGAGKAPVLVYLYGGSWKSGSRGIYGFLGRAFAARGLCTVVPDYRLHPEISFPGFVEDAARALAWVRDHIGQHGGDPDRIVVMGHSAGAHIGALLCLDPRWLGAAGLSPADIRGFVGLAGPYSFNPLEAASVRAVFEAAPDIALARPIKQVRAGAPPMTLIHGTRDRTVGVHNSEHLAAAISDSGGDARLIRYPGIGHIEIMAALTWPLRWRAPVLRDSLQAIEDFIVSKSENLPGRHP